jgi:hypothetical protein
MSKPKIVRTASKALGGITPEETLRMGGIAKEWIDIAMRTRPIDPSKIVPAIEGIYAVAKLKKPRVVIVPSPLVMAFAYGASAWIWYCRKNKNHAATDAATDDATRAAADAATDAATRAATGAATRAATDAATSAATYDATDATTSDATDAATDAATRAATSAATDAATHAATGAATDDATYAATDAATDSATRAATRAATEAATYSATRAATDSATDAATYDATRAATGAATLAATDAATDASTRAATRAATDAATRAATSDATDTATRAATYSAKKVKNEKQALLACMEMASEGGVICSMNWHSSYQGGNMWAGWCSYLVAFKDVLGLKLKEHKNFSFYEEAAREGGFRVMHEEFCIVCDFPEVLKKDDRNLPHCEDGPSHKWRDGWSLYHWHGVRIPEEWIEDKKSLSPKKALTWKNIEQRRAACEIVGWNRILKELNAKVIDEDAPEIGTLLEVELPDSGNERFLRVRCATNREFAIPVPKEVKTAMQANAWTYGLDPKQFRPEVRT